MVSLFLIHLKARFWKLSSLLIVVLEEGRQTRTQIEHFLVRKPPEAPILPHTNLCVVNKYFIICIRQETDSKLTGNWQETDRELTVDWQETDRVIWMEDSTSADLRADSKETSWGICTVSQHVVTEDTCKDITVL